MKKEEIYNDLINQYNLLTDDEKNAITIYKSGLFFHINSISNNSDLSSSEIFNLLDEKNEFIDRFQKYKDVINNPKNMFLKYSVFKDINFNDIESFIDSIKLVYKN